MVPRACSAVTSLSLACGWTWLWKEAICPALWGPGSAAPRVAPRCPSGGGGAAGGGARQPPALVLIFGPVLMSPFFLSLGENWTLGSVVMSTGATAHEAPRRQ